MPASGKTTVAEGLAGRLRLPLIAKDDIKEGLYESLGAPPDVETSGRMGGAAYALILRLARTMLDSGVSVVVEANFFRDRELEFESLPAHRTIQIHCHAPLPVFIDRYARRSRHVGHHDSEKVEELPARFESGAHSPLALDGVLIELDTTSPVDLDALAERLRSAL
jgi:predicted kinase